MCDRIYAKEHLVEKSIGRQIPKDRRPTREGEDVSLSITLKELLITICN
jgi:hypothetical protein